MTMIIGIVASTKIVLASDTRCMIGDPNHYLAYHEQARKIAISLQTSPYKMACTFASSVQNGFGSIQEHSKYIMESPYRNEPKLIEIHHQFEEKYRQINDNTPSKYQVTSIFAKFEQGYPCISYGNLSNNPKLKSKGVFSLPPIQIGSYENEDPTDEQAVQFVKDKINDGSKKHTQIGHDIEIVYVTSTAVDWIQKQNWTPLPTKTDELYAEWKKDSSILKQIDKKQSVEEWKKELEQWFRYKMGK